MVWKEVVARSSAYLGTKGVPEAEVAVELMAARLLKCGRGFLASHLDKDADERHLEAMRRGMSRLVKGEPIQYVLGEWDFRSLTLKCDRRALIPRPETEELVTRVLKFLADPQRSFAPAPVIFDIGTGTGAIILSLAKEFKGDGVFVGTDISEDAIQLARVNAEMCGLAERVKFVVGDGLDDVDEPECIDIIVSNPPYIESAVCETLDPRVRDFEPRLALDGGADGLVFYERYLSDAINVLRPNGAVFFEIGENQGAAVADLMKNFGFVEICIEKDWAGHDRYASARLP